MHTIPLHVSTYVMASSLPLFLQTMPLTVGADGYSAAEVKRLRQLSGHDENTGWQKLVRVAVPEEYGGGFITHKINRFTSMGKIKQEVSRRSVWVHLHI